VASASQILVVKGPRSNDRHWSAAAERTLDALGTWEAVQIDPAAPPEEHTSQAARLDAALSQASALLLCGWGPMGISYFSADRLARAPHLRFIGSTCHYRQAQFVDMKVALARGIAFCETAPAMSPWVAEHELALGLAALRQIPQEHAIVGAGGWVDMLDVPDWPDRLHGRRVGLASFGEIHRHLARMLAPFETEWEAFDPYVPSDVITAAGGRKVDSLVAMAARSDVFFVATPPTPETLGTINRDVIAALPHHAVFVLVSRMAVVEQEPLLHRLRAGALRAAIDVYDPEPPPDGSPWRTLPSVIHTPHRAGNTRGAHQGVFLAQCQEAQRHFAGELLRYPLRPELVALFHPT